MHLQFIVFLVLLAATASSSRPLSFIGSDASCKPQVVLEKYFNQALSDSQSIDQAVNIIGCIGSDGECDLINGLLGSQFPAEVNQISLDVVDSSVLVYGNFDQMFGSKLSGGRVVDFFAQLDQPLVVVAKYDGADSFSLAYDQVFRRLLTVYLEKTEKKPVAVLVESVASPDAASAAVEAVVDSIWREIGGEGKWTERDGVKIIVVDRDNASSLEAAKVELTSFVDLARAEPVPPPTFAGRLLSTWSALPAAPRPLPSKAQQQSLFVVENAYVKLLQQAEAALGQLRKRVEAGKVISAFPKRIHDILSSVISEYSGLVTGSMAVRERLDRLRMLRDHIVTSAIRLFEQQIDIKEFQLMKQFRKELAHAYAQSSEDGSALQAVVRKAMLDFKAAISSLEDESLGFVVSSGHINDYSSKLQAIAKEYPESAEAKLTDVKRMEREVSRKPRKKNRGKNRAISVSMNLVGMLRPPGYGNLQGFVGYATSLLGLPVDLLLGVQNDGDSPEIMGEDREHPILRIQPKFNFDIDL